MQQRKAVMTSHDAPHAYSWVLNGPNSATAEVSYTARLISDDMSAFKSAVLEGVGIANLPLRVVENEIRNGLLIIITPDWRPLDGVIMAVIPSRRGVLPSVRSLIDFLAKSFQEIQHHPG
ncbi:LysR substrate binding domain protein [compost metagenome]